MALGTYRKLLLVIGDLALFWAGLLVTLSVRYGITRLDRALLPLHIVPFSIVFAVWLVVFYIAGLYDFRAVRSYQTTLKLLASAMATGGVIAIMLFYFVPAFTITPRTNLIIDIFLSTALLALWRSLVIFANKNTSKIRVMLVGQSPDIAEIEETIHTIPELGYKVVSRFEQIPDDIASHVNPINTDMVVAPREAQSHTALVQALYESLGKRVRFVDATRFYEELFGKIPVSLISKMWFLENIAEAEKNFFEAAKRAVDIVLSLPLGILALALFPFVSLAIRLDTEGPIFIRQKRVGKLGRVYTHYKYRTMRALSPEGHAELNGVEWTQKGDERVTRVGKFLRSTRIDELPQIWNILKGELSFVGPRPERPEFVENLRKEIPYYDVRHLVRPGLSGWAQINPPYYYASLEDTYLKLQYDLYYIKNRDWGLDIAIALKTLLVILSRQGR
ncbi:MAG: sugar transferase [Candidatus Ryanbacteria bacterium]|nr:sugar transferase [Candidatus Ryanbacteria bacterium]